MAKEKTRTKRFGFFRSFLFSNVHASLLAILAELLKTKHAVYLGKQGVVFADTDVDAGMDVGTTLANENVAGENELTVSALGAKALGLGVTAVLGGAHTFFMSEELKTDVHHGKFHPFCKMMRGQET